MQGFIEATTLMGVLLNPFLIIIFLIDVVQKWERGKFARLILRAGLTATVVFSLFAAAGDALFTSVVQVRFESFQIFGGLVFLFIGFQYFFKGPTAIEILRGDSDNLAGAIAMPVMIGPGTISASIVVGKSLPPWWASLAILTAMLVSVLIMIGLKILHDAVRPRNETLIQRYIEVTGRINALYIGTVAIEMIMRGTRDWAGLFK